MRRLIFLPSRHLALSIPVVLALGFLVGLLVDTSVLTRYILLVAVLMIYPSMIGFKLRDLMNLGHSRLLLTCLGINFGLIPLLAYFLGVTFLLREPQLFAGLAITALLPTSNMTIAFTMMAGGNVPAAVKLTVLSLVLGALLAPWYLLVMVGKYVPIDLWAILQTIGLVVFLPLVLGVATYSWLLRRYTQEQFAKSIKPYLPAATAWGMVYIVFTSISTNAHRIVSNPDLLLLALGVQAVFYLVNYGIAIQVGRCLFDKRDALALVFGTVMRNLSISIGLAATAFGPNAALMVALAFVFQSQSGAWFTRICQKGRVLPTRRLGVRGLAGLPTRRWASSAEPE